VVEVAHILWAIGSYQRAFNLSFHLLAAKMLLPETNYYIDPSTSPISHSASSADELLLLIGTMKHLLDVFDYGDKINCTFHIQLADTFLRLEQPKEAENHCLHAWVHLKRLSGYLVDKRALASLILEREKTISECGHVLSTNEKMDSYRNRVRVFKAENDNDECLRDLFK
jgi:hypothetical protein